MRIPQISPSAGLALRRRRARLPLVVLRRALSRPGRGVALAGPGLLSWRAGLTRSPGVELAALRVGHAVLPALLLPRRRVGGAGGRGARRPRCRRAAARRRCRRVGRVQLVRGHVLRHEVAVREALSAHHTQVGLVLVEVGHHVRHVVAVRRRALAAHPARVLHEGGGALRPRHHGHVGVRRRDGRRARVRRGRHPGGAAAQGRRRPRPRRRRLEDVVTVAQR